MGKKGGGSAPTPPDPAETARAEAQINRVNTYSPNGSGVRWGYTGGDGNFVGPGFPAAGEGGGGGAPAQAPAAAAPARRQLSIPRGSSDDNSGRTGLDIQADRQAAAASGGTGGGGGGEPAGGRAAQMYVESPTERAIREMLEPASVGFTERFTDEVANMPDQARVRDRSDVADSIFNRSFSLMAPGIDRANEKLLVNLQARGLPVGSEAFNSAYGEQLAQTQDTISRLAMDADVAAGQEQERLYRLDASERSAAMSELMSVMGGQYQAPQNIPSGNTNPINYSGMVSDQYNRQLSQYNQQQQQSMATASTLGSMGAALLKSTMAAKDVRGEVDTTNAARIVGEMPLSVWAYREGEAPAEDVGRNHIGPMAEHFHAMTGLGEPTHIHMADYMGLLMSALQNALHRIEVLERDRNGTEVH